MHNRMEAGHLWVMDKRHYRCAESLLMVSKGRIECISTPLVDLMSGSNNNMSTVKNVATGLDGTDSSLTPYSWSCPEVDPYSAIYFYQFTNGDDTLTRTWTTRFTVRLRSLLDP